MISDIYLYVKRQELQNYICLWNKLLKFKGIAIACGYPNFPACQNIQHLCIAHKTTLHYVTWRGNEICERKKERSGARTNCVKKFSIELFM